MAQRYYLTKYRDTQCNLNLQLDSCQNQTCWLNSISCSYTNWLQKPNYGLIQMMLSNAPCTGRDRTASLLPFLLRASAPVFLGATSLHRDQSSPTTSGLQKSGDCGRREPRRWALIPAAGPTYWKRQLFIPLLENTRNQQR